MSCQERFQRLLRVAQAHRSRSLGFANFKKKTRHRLLERPSIEQGMVEYSVRMTSFSFITTLSAEYGRGEHFRYLLCLKAKQWK